MTTFVPSPEAYDWAAQTLIDVAYEASDAIGARPARELTTHILLIAAGHFAEHGTGAVPDALGLLTADAARSTILEGAR